MFETLSDIRITGIVRGNSTAQATIGCRPSHTLIYKINGESIYELRGASVRLCAGTVLYIPEGESYSFQKVSEGDSLYCLINFHCKTKVPEQPHLFTLRNTEHVQYVFGQILRRWQLANGEADRFELLSIFYHLISLLLQNRDGQYHTAAQYARLEPALSYLEENLFSHGLTISRLAELCGTSSVTFRELFHDRFGESPKKYVIRCRLMKAKAIIESGEFSSINEVAFSVGYDDPLYFSRHFKSFFGCAPSKL